MWSISSPTIEDSEMDVLASLGGRPILLYDPIFINDLTKYFRNTSDQSAENAHDILQELTQQENLKSGQLHRVNQQE